MKLGEIIHLLSALFFGIKIVDFLVIAKFLASLILCESPSNYLCALLGQCVFLHEKCHHVSSGKKFHD